MEIKSSSNAEINGDIFSRYCLFKVKKEKNIHHNLAEALWNYSAFGLFATNLSHPPSSPY
jgi:hypothetical protein